MGQCNYRCKSSWSNLRTSVASYSVTTLTQSPPPESDPAQSVIQKFKEAIQTRSYALATDLMEQHRGLQLLNTTFGDGNSVLHVAVQQKHIQLVRYCLSNGLSANLQNQNNGDTPLHIAARQRTLDIISLLTEHKADVNISNHNDISPWMIAPDIIQQPLSTSHALGTLREDEECVIDHVSQMHTQYYSLATVAEHNCLEQGIWIVIGDGVYDITVFIKCNLHPASNAFIEPLYGKDATEPFDRTFHSVEAVKLLQTLQIGEVQPSERNSDVLQKAISLRKSLTSLRDRNTYRSKLRVQALFIYPVKGMKGIAVQRAELGLGGFVDDRIYAVVHKATNKVINQLTYPELALIDVAFKDGSSTCDEGIQLNDMFVPFLKEETLLVEWKSCNSKILVYDQGTAVSEWITSFLNDDGCKDEFLLVRIHENNYRESEDYFALTFAPKETQRMSAFQNYCPVALASVESINELNRRYKAKEHSPGDDEEIDLERFRKNIIICGVVCPHYEDFMKRIVFGHPCQERKRAEILWSRRRYLCGVPQINQNTASKTDEPMDTTRRYRNAITLNDRTALPGDDAIFFGCLYGVKHDGIIEVNQCVVSEHEKLEYDSVRTAAGKSYYGLTEHNIGSQFVLNYLTQYERFKLILKKQYNHDTLQLRFEMVDQSHTQHKSLKESVHMGDHYLFKYTDADNKPVIRMYTPIFDGNAGDMAMDVLIKVYEKGKMTQHLSKMDIGDTILCRINCGKVCYFEVGKIRFGDQRMTMFAPYNLNVNRLNLIAGGSGITPMYQIISNIHLNKEFDHTKISFIFANKTEKDILLRDKLEEIANTNENIKVHYVISRPETKNENENGFDVGRLNLNICKKYLFPPSNADDLNVVTLLCGPHPMVLAVKQCLTQIGYDDKSVATF
eukprot:336188_1